MRHDRRVLSETYLGKRLELHPKGRFSEWPEETKINILCEDADIGLQLYHHFKLELQKDNLKVLFEEIEIPLLRVLAQMELNGIRLDTPYLSELNSEFSSQIEKLENQIYEQAGETFNIGSPKQLGIVLFENLQLSKKTQKDQNRTIRYRRRYTHRIGKRASNCQRYFSISKLNKAEKHLCRCAPPTG
jgi:DNA polymerase-1